MICPLMSYQEIGGNRVKCQKEKCAWWVQHLSDKEGDCAIKLLGEERIEVK